MASESSSTTTIPTKFRFASFDPIFREFVSGKLEYIVMTVDDDELLVKAQSASGKTAYEYNAEGTKIDPFLSWMRFTNDITEFKIAFGCCYVTHKSRDGVEETDPVFIYWCTRSALWEERLKYSKIMGMMRSRLSPVLYKLNCESQYQISYNEISRKMLEYEVLTLAIDI